MIDTMKTDQPVLLYDGKCGFCQATVQFVLRHDRRRSLRFATLEGGHGRAVIEANPALEGVDSVVWVEKNAETGLSRVLTRSDAALQIAGYLGGAWSSLSLFRVLPRPWRDRIYDFVARHRQRLMGSSESCLVPSAEDRHRFLD
jgi:predicted DCC family thiol-disulfide oxidoreductase YuxK